jgi:hypothetical protein
MLPNYTSKPDWPNFILAGFPKSATTSIAQYLDRHPSICFSNPKEPNFFNLGDGNYSHKSWEKYANSFSHWQPNQILGEGTQRYTIRDNFPNVAQNIYKNIPTVKLIFIARNPKERMISHFKGLDSRNKLSFSINEIFEHQWLLNRCVNTSKYFYQMEPYLELFPRKQIWIGFYEDFIENKTTFFQELFEFLELKKEPLLNILNDQEIKIKTDAKVPKNQWISQKLNQTFLCQSLKKILPIELQNKCKNLLYEYKESNSEKYQICPNIRERFINEIEEDMKKFLELSGKSANFWHL